jgi:hypothetical protein
VTRRPGAWRHRSTCAKSGAAQHAHAVHALVAAAQAGDPRGFERMLHPAVVLTVDGGGIVAAPAAAVDGASAVGGYLTRELIDPAVSLRQESVNGAPGIVVCRAGRVTGVLSIRVERRRVREAWLVVNPRKLTHWDC